MKFINCAFEYDASFLLNELMKFINCAFERVQQILLQSELGHYSSSPLTQAPSLHDLS